MVRVGQLASPGTQLMYLVPQRHWVVANFKEAQTANIRIGQPATLRVDGGMVVNDMLMQFQADLLGVDVVRPTINETTALGAAYAAGLAVGYWSDTAEIVANWSEDHRWSPQMPEAERERLYRNWKKAVTKAHGWVDEDTP